MKNKISFKALLKKDIKIFFLNKQVIITASILIGMFCILYPLIFTVAVISGDMSDLPIDPNESITNPLEILRLLFNFISIFLVLIPLMLGNFLGNSIITIEKESKTLETILYCPMQTKDLLKTKIMVSFIPGIIASLGSFLLSIIVINFVCLSNGVGLFLPNLTSFLIFILLAPSLLFLALLFTVKFSAKSENSTQAQQKSVVFLLPLIFVSMIILSVCAMLDILVGSIFIIVSSLIAIIIAIFMFKNIIKNFTPEFLLK